MLSATDAACPNLINHSQYMCLLHLCPSKNQLFLLGGNGFRLDRGKKKNSPSTLPKLWIFINQAAKKKLPMSFLFNFHNWRFFFLKKSLDPNSAMTSWDQLWKWSKPWIHFHQSPRRPQRNKRTALVGFQNCSANSTAFSSRLHCQQVLPKKNAFTKFHQTSYAPEAAIISL